MHADRRCDRVEGIRIADIQAIHEVRPEELIDQDTGRQLQLLRAMDEAMGSEGVGAHRHGIEVEGDPRLGTHFGQSGVHRIHRRDPAELALQEGPIGLSPGGVSGFRKNGNQRSTGSTSGRADASCMSASWRRRFPR